MLMTQALFESAGDAVLPTNLALGPWAPGLLHGGPVAALCIDAAEHDAGRFVSLRATLEFVRPLVQAPFTVDVRPLREGRRLRVVEVTVSVSGVTIAHATVLQISPVHVDVPAQRTHAPDEDPGSMAPFALQAEQRAPGITGPTFFTDGVEIRVPDTSTFFGAGIAWFRLAAPVMPGRPGSGLARAAAIADFGNGVSAPSPPGTMPLSFVNASLDVALARPVEGDWIRLAARSEWAADGYGLTRSDLADVAGPVGVAQQVLVLQPMP
jgi:acyl-CoA thioesterase